jgi:hypothetical protein
MASNTEINRQKTIDAGREKELRYLDSLLAVCKAKLDAIIAALGQSTVDDITLRWARDQLADLRSDSEAGHLGGVGVHSFYHKWSIRFAGIDRVKKQAEYITKMSEAPLPAQNAALADQSKGSAA